MVSLSESKDSSSRAPLINLLAFCKHAYVTCKEYGMYDAVVDGCRHFCAKMSNCNAHWVEEHTAQDFVQSQVRRVFSGAFFDRP